ncbi:hypothetical protein HQQ92_23230 [Shewanella sp. DC2-4]|uniref:hypothetical protein n=1 Tax=Shewanella sp. DC2-4 TaxID=2739431 RepID=UPI0015652421|nr:hypothetical protein [Shewanella sp. DC2-4]NRD34632.1 hypothetical protein [Shewanella sp. DC2-4]
MIEIEAIGDQNLPIQITLNSGVLKFTRKAAIELQQKLNLAIDEMYENERLCGYTKRLADDAKHVITSCDLPTFEHFICYLRMCGFGLFSFSHSQETLDSEQGMAYLAEIISHMMRTDHETAITLSCMMKSRTAALNEKSLNDIKREITPFCASDVINYLNTKTQK